MAEKTCFKCGEAKPLEEFYRHAQMADGHLNKCKECTKADVHAHRYSDARDRVLSYDRERGQLPHRKQLRLMISDRWLKEHPTFRKAHSHLHRGIRSGEVEKLPCFICGDLKTEGHHPGYSAPLSVVWLCRAHHMQAHALHLRLTRQQEAA